MIRMIVTDLDGTLLAGKSNLPEKNIEALKRTMEAGAKVVIASGRMIESTVPIARKIGVNAPMVVMNGAMVYDLQEDRILSGVTIAKDTARKILAEIEARGCYVQAFPGRNYYMHRANEWTKYYSEKIGVTGVETGIPLSEWLQTDVYKLLCLGEKDALDELAQELAPIFPEACFVKSGETHLEIIAQGVDKATGLRYISEMTGISAGEMIAFGDEANDLPILKFAATGYAMENCADSVRSEMRSFAPKNTESGVAKIVNLYLDEGKIGGLLAK